MKLKNIFIVASMMIFLASCSSSNSNQSNNNDKDDEIKNTGVYASELKVTCRVTNIYNGIASGPIAKCSLYNSSSHYVSNITVKVNISDKKNYSSGQLICDDVSAGETVECDGFFRGSRENYFNPVATGYVLYWTPKR